MEKKKNESVLHLITPVVVMFHSVTATRTQHMSGVRIYFTETLDTTGVVSPTVIGFIYRGSTSLSQY